MKSDRRKQSKKGATYRTVLYMVVMKLKAVDRSRAERQKPSFNATWYSLTVVAPLIQRSRQQSYTGGLSRVPHAHVLDVYPKQSPSSLPLSP